MRPKDAKELIETCITAQQPVFLWGGPGIGKSDIVKSIAKEHEIPLIDFRALLYEPIDLRGLPSIAEGITKWNIPDFLPKEGEGIFFLDELNAAPQSMQAACYQLILDRKIGDYKLPDGWSIIAAGNRETDRGAAQRMQAPLANRFIHLTLEPDTDDWIQWAINNGIIIEILAFLRFRPNLLYAFDPAKSNEKAFPTPRSWAMLSRLLDNLNAPQVIRHNAILGMVGPAATAEFSGFLDIYRELPSIDSILLDPTSAPIPEKPAALYAVCTALARKASQHSIGRIIQYANRLRDEFSTLCILDCKRFAEKEIIHTREFIDWCCKHSDVLV